MDASMKLRQTYLVAAGVMTAIGVGACGSTGTPASASNELASSDAAIPGDSDVPRRDAADPITTPPDSGTPAEGGTTCDGGALGPPTTHRASSVACPPTSAGSGVFPDGGPSCTTDSECADGGGWSLKCLQGKCSIDQCLADSDCPAGTTCGCSNSYYGGNAIHVNACIMSSCRLDSDCGPGGYCSPSFGAYCGGLTGFYCHGPADTCANNADCSCGPSSAGACAYQPTVGHWQCAAPAVCAG